MLISKVTCIAFKVYILSVISFLGNQIHEFEVTSSMFYHLGYCYTLQISKYMPEIPNPQSDWQAQTIYDWLKHILFAVYRAVTRVFSDNLFSDNLFHCVKLLLAALSIMKENQYPESATFNNQKYQEWELFATFGRFI